jgi:exonuclease V gamma subunit
MPCPAETSWPRCSPATGCTPSARTTFRSYSRENLEASRKLQTQRQPPGPFFAAPLPEPEDEWRTVDIDRLCRFFTHPVRFLLQQRLQILLEAGDEAIEDREAFDLDHLERYLVKENLLARRLAHQDLGPALELERALGRLPHGQVGECRFTALSRDVNAFYLDLEPYVRAPMLEPLTIDLELGGFRLLGRLDGFFEAGTTPGDGSGHPMHSPPLADNAADSVLSSPPLRGAGGNAAELRNVRLTTGGDKPRPYGIGRRSGVGAGFIPARNGPMTVAHSIALGDQGGGMATNGSPPPDLPRQEGGKPGKDYRRALMVRFRSAKVTARDRLNLWIRHLALNAAETALVPRTSILLGTDGAWEYAPVPDAPERLRQLLEIYWQGLCQPLKFFPKLSYAYAQAVRAGKPPEAALAAARQGWQGSGPGDQRPPGEAEDPYHTLCFAAREPIDDEFMQLAAAVFDPVLDHEQKAANAGYVSPLA